MSDFSLASLFSSDAFSILLPEVWVLAGIVIALLFSVSGQAKYAWYTSALFLFFALLDIIFIQAPGHLWSAANLIPSQEILGGAFYFDNHSIFFRMIIYFVSMLICMASAKYLRKLESPAEYYPLLLTATLGGAFLVAANDLLTFFVALETMTLSSILITSYARKEQGSNEAGIKFLINSAIATGIMLLGLSFIYGLTGETNFTEIAVRLYSLVQADAISLPVQALIAVSVIVGIGFKLSAAPFHNWAPDVYTGAPTTTTLFLSVVSKVAAFGLAIRLFGTLLASNLIISSDLINNLLALLAIASIVVGNYVGVSQIINRASIKKLLAYSSIAQSGYLLIGLAVFQVDTLSALVLYLAVYAVMNTAAFIAAIYFEQETGSDEIYDLAGLIQVKPWTAIVFGLALINLAGLPFIPAGFIAKFFLFSSAYASGMSLGTIALGKVLAVVGLLGSVIGLFYYLYLAKIMIVDSPSIALQGYSPQKSDNDSYWTLAENFAIHKAMGFALVVLLAMGVFATYFFERISFSVISGLGV